MLPVQRPELEAIYRQTVGKHARTVCVTAADRGEGVSTVALALARRAAAAGLRALLVDANLPNPAISAQLGLRRTRWSPADGSAPAAVALAQGIDLGVLPAPVGVDSLAFREPEEWRRMLETDLAAYELIVVDASPVNSFHDRAVPAESIAAACAATVLVVLTGVTSERSLQAAAEHLTMAGASLCGAVFNDRFNPSLADELCQGVDKLVWFSPRLARWFRRRVHGSAILNLQV